MSRARTLLVVLISYLTLAACDSEPEQRTGEPTAEHSNHSEDEGRGEDEDHRDGEGVLAFTQEEIDAASIEVATAAPARISEVLTLYGTVQPNAERVRTVAARFPGVIQKVNAAVGDRVAAGAVLASVEANESLQTYNVTAPLAGIVTARNANPGESTGESALFTLADLSSVWVELALFPRDLARVRTGQTVRVRTVDAGLEGIGKIVYVAPITQAGQQTISARVLLDNKEARWAPGLYVAAEVVVAEREAPVAIKSVALQRVENDTVAFIRTDEGFRVQPIIAGSSDHEWTEIREGIANGERYAANNSFVLKADLGAGEAEHEH